ncbi:MAG: DUF4328 domain-containing protein [Verrucomicrobiota bacterium]
MLSFKSRKVSGLATALLIECFSRPPPERTSGSDKSADEIGVNVEAPHSARAKPVAPQSSGNYETEQTDSSADSPYAPPKSFVSAAAAPAPESLSPYGPYQSPAALGRALTICLFVYTAAVVASGFAMGWMFQSTSGVDFENLTEEKAATIELTSSVTIGVGALQTLILIACIIIWCFWKSRVVKNAFAFGANWIRVTPGWAVGFYFIPIAHWFKPFQAMNDAWRASEHPKFGQSASTSPLVGWWWAVWIVGGFIERGASKMLENPNVLTDGGSSFAWGAVATAAGAASAIMAAALVLRLTKLQIKRAEEMGIA